MPAFVDRRAGSAQYLDLLQSRGVPALHSTLPYGDVSFNGHGPKGKVKVGVEIKTTADFEDSFSSKRLLSQLVGMVKEYQHIIILVTGQAPIHPGYAFTFWFQAGILLHRELDEQDAADWLASLYNWWQKPWNKHSSLKGLELPRQGKDESLIPVDPSPTRLWSACLPGIGWELSGRVAREFASPLDLATASEDRWGQIQGIGPKRATAIRHWIRGLYTAKYKWTR